MTETYEYGIKDLDGKPVPDSQATPVMQDIMLSTGDYALDCKNNICAYCVNGTRMPLSSIENTRVKFIGGLWRVQNKHQKYKITNVRDKKLILGERIHHTEKNLFEYYRAAEVCENCYGIMKPQYTYIVAKYDTDNGPMWAYGATIEQARAFLGIALFDKHIDMIHNAERKNFNRQK